MKKITETERLELREFGLGDAQNFYELNLDPEVMRHTGDIAFDSPEDAQTFLNNYTDYAEHGFGRWAVIKKETGTFIGWCGLKKNEEGHVDIGFRLLRSSWGQGYATEAARACLEYGFGPLNLEEIIGRASRLNSASIRVLEKLGMDFWKYGTCEGIQHAVYYRMSLARFLHDRAKTTSQR